MLLVGDVLPFILGLRATHHFGLCSPSGKEWSDHFLILYPWLGLTEKNLFLWVGWWFDTTR